MNFVTKIPLKRWNRRKFLASKVAFSKKSKISWYPFKTAGKNYSQSAWWNRCEFCKGKKIFRKLSTGPFRSSSAICRHWKMKEQATIITDRHAKLYTFRRADHCVQSDSEPQMNRRSRSQYPLFYRRLAIRFSGHICKQKHHWNLKKRNWSTRVQNFSETRLLIIYGLLW